VGLARLVLGYRDSQFRARLPANGRDAPGWVALFGGLPLLDLALLIFALGPSVDRVPVTTALDTHRGTRGQSKPLAVLMPTLQNPSAELSSGTFNGHAGNEGLFFRSPTVVPADHMLTGPELGDQCRSFGVGTDASC
jgi:hypothetical protein